MSTTTIWKIQVPVGSRYAELNRHYKKPKGKKCAKCSSIIAPTHEPITVEWDDGSDQVGDFVHAGADIVLQDRVAEQLRRIATGFATAAIVFYDHPGRLACGHSTWKWGDCSAAECSVARMEATVHPSIRIRG
ncbi:MAG: hypothetical protein R3C53_00870 [Pirellulaceae bacterium]